MERPVARHQTVELKAPVFAAKESLFPMLPRVSLLPIDHLEVSNRFSLVDTAARDSSSAL